MKKCERVVAICYDFDGTLSPGNMQEYGFFSGLGAQAKNFWKESDALSKKHHADPVLAYMKLMIDRASVGNVPTTKEAFKRYGATVDLFAGVRTWFKRMNTFGEKNNLQIEHYIVSSGLKEMIEGSPIAKEFTKIYACSFIYDNNSVAQWPAVAVNYTTKTQFLFRINKGVIDDNDNALVNAFVPDEKRRVPFHQMIYIGDGITDIPCMKLVKEKGGNSIAVYHPNSKTAKKTSENLQKEERVNYIAQADYSARSELELLVKKILGEMANKKF